jgi:drug/metabolite transporter (DMT)-like permease
MKNLVRRGIESRSYVFFIALGACITSFSAVFVKSAGAHPDVAGFYRNFFGLCALTVLLIARKDRPVSGWPSVWISALCALFFFLDLALWHRAIGYIGPGLSTLLANFQVFILAAVSVFFLRERVVFMFFVSIILALTGLLLVVNPFTFTIGSSFGKGVILALLTSVCYAGFIISLRLVKKRAPEMSSVSVMWLVSLFCSVYFFTEITATGGSLAIENIPTVAYLIAYGVFSQCIGWVIITRSLPHVYPSIAGLLLLIQPALSYLWDVVIFSKVVTPVEFVGVLIAFGAIYLGTRLSAK